ncbi:SLBB domain-containing protein [Pseudomonadales bacterium]|nr:SLBB domain-containing protein [Pseudomonadales bacterium]MDC1307575.1 SLBB domain-containing protein [Pseudomonadales bacterium]MDC1368303.1 SLBB domain-containing protein [Pseudomonadales bacterium]
MMIHKRVLQFAISVTLSLLAGSVQSASDSFEPILDTLQYAQKQQYMKAAPSGNDEPLPRVATSVVISDAAVQEVASSIEKLAETKTQELSLDEQRQSQALDQELAQFGYEIFNRGELLQIIDHVVVPTGYKVGPGDTLIVQLYGKRNVEYRLVVTREGEILIPEFGPMSVAGLPFHEVRDLIVDSFDSRVIGAKTAVTMGEIRAMQVRLTGDVVAPGIYSVNGLATLVDALLASGGIKTSGSLRDIQLRRNGQLVQRLDLYQLLLAGGTQDDVALEHNDVIFVPPIGDVVYVGGEVQRPAIYELKGDTSLQSVLAMAGGLLPTASMDKSYIERIVTNSHRTLVNLSEVPVPETIKIQPGDYLRVMPLDDRLDQVVMLSGHVKRPGGYQYQPAMRVSDLVSSPDVLLRNADLDFALLSRETKGTRRTEVIYLDLSAILRFPGTEKDVLLQPRDEVILFNLEQQRASLLASVNRVLDIQATAYQPAPTITVLGNVRYTGRFPLEPGVRLIEALQVTGGVLPGTDMAYAVIFRRVMPSNRIEPIHIQLADAFAQPTSAANPVLAPQDRIYLFAEGTDRAGLMRGDIQRLTEFGQYRDDPLVVHADGLIRSKGAYPLTDGMRASDLLCAGDGLTMNADGVQAELSRHHKVIGGEVHIEHISLDAEYLVDICSETRTVAQEVAAMAMQAYHAKAALPLANDGRIKNIIDPVRFDLGKADIDLTDIQKIENVLAQYAGTDQTVSVVLIGHTDDTPLSAATREKYGDNLGLSIARAWEVADIIHKLLPSNVVIEVEGMGATQGIASNATAAGRALNRRVDIHLEVKTAKQETSLQPLQNKLVADPAGVVRLFDDTKNPLLKSGDQLIFVERNGWRNVAKVVLKGEVARPGTYVIDRGETMCEVMQRAGGLTSSAWSFGAEFTRESTRALQKETLDRIQEQLDDLMVELSLSHSVNNHEKTPAGGDKDEYLKVLERLKSAEPKGREIINLERAMTCDKRHDLVMEDGDQLYVPVRHRQVTVAGQVYVPTSHAYIESRSIRDYIELSGGATVIGRLSDAYAVQANGEVMRLKGKRFLRSKKDPLPGATIYVPLNVDRMNVTERVQAWTRSLVEVALFAGVIL